MPEAWCSPSMFWVMTAATLPRRTSASTARCPRLGSAALKMSSIAKRRRQVSRRASSEATNSSKYMGAIWVQMPPGLRKSGIPDSVLMPAPVNTTARRDCSISRFSAATPVSSLIGLLWQIRRSPPSLASAVHFQHDTKSGAAAHHAFISLGDTVEWVDFVHRAHSCQGAEREGLLRVDRGAGIPALDRPAAHDQR